MQTYGKLLVAPLLVFMLVQPLLAQPGPGRGRGPGRGTGTPHGGAGQRPDERHHADQNTLNFLLTHQQQIRREVQELPNGVETITESDDKDIAGRIQEHVLWMQHRIDNTQPIRMRDPLFAELFQHTDSIHMVRTNTAKEVRVTETSDDPAVAKLIKSHAQAVSGFVARGVAAARQNHAVPEQNDSAPHTDVVTPAYTNPVIRDYGKVIRLPTAAQQPRNGSRIVVDITKAGDADKLNPGIEKIARFVNIYQGAGQRPATAQIAIVLHGDATLTVLKADAYAARFNTTDNPNLDCLQQLHTAGVQIYVCGQSLIGKDAQPRDVFALANVAVSALTSLVNLQSDGYAYVPMLK